MKWILSLIAWVWVIMGLPAGMCAVYNYYTGLLEADLNTTVSLYLSMVSIMVTVFLTWYVYRSDQRREEKAANRAREDAKCMVTAVLRTGLHQVIYRTGGHLKITDELIRLAVLASKGLPIEKARTLMDYMRTLQNIGDTDLDDWDEANEKAFRFALTFLPEPTKLFRERILEAKNWEWLVRGDAQELFVLLDSPLDSPPEIIKDKKGLPVYQEYEPGRYRVWAKDGRVLLDGSFRDEDVLDGYAELRDGTKHQLYRGQYLNGYRHGYGIEYFTDEEKNEDYISKEGIWKRGKLYNGIIYCVVLDDEKDNGEYYSRSPFDWVFQLETPEKVRANMDCYPPFRMCDVQMIDGEVQVLKESIQTVDDFCQNWKAHTRPLAQLAFERKELYVEPSQE